MKRKIGGDRTNETKKDRRAPGIRHWIILPCAPVGAGNPGNQALWDWKGTEIIPKLKDFQSLKFNVVVLKYIRWNILILRELFAQFCKSGLWFLILWNCQHCVQCKTTDVIQLFVWVQVRAIKCLPEHLQDTKWLYFPLPETRFMKRDDPSTILYREIP